MASTLLERTRESHEEIERLERAVCADFRHEAVTHKERLAQNHRVRSMLDDAATKAKRLVRASHELPIRNPKHAKDHHGNAPPPVRIRKVPAQLADHRAK